jgi:hypothetical protein
MRTAARWLAATLVFGTLLLGLAPAAVASPPDNDHFANADVVSGLPFTDSGDLAGMTTEEGEPSSACSPSAVQTVWYAFTPTTTGTVRVETTGSDFSVAVVAYQSDGTGIGGLSLVGCAGGFGSSPMTLAVTGGTTYYLHASSLGSGPAHLQLHIAPVLPPPNDDFADASALSGLPASATADLTVATIEPGEPQPGEPLSSSVWYSFTPTAGGTLLAKADGDFAATLAVYTGSSLPSLSLVATGSVFAPASFAADEGTTYQIQLARRAIFPGGPSPVTVTIQALGPPVAGFVVMPPDPSIHETVQFYDMSFDPGFVGLGPARWDFGDGAVATDCCPTHRYAADGDYTVTMIATTLDGRTASTTQVVLVRTRDVAIERIQAPTSARVGQAKPVTVKVKGGRYAETVQVDLYKSVAGGFDQLVGSQTLPVPVATKGGATAFKFSYTFTSEDGAAGTVTFRAVASILGHRDTSPSPPPPQSCHDGSAPCDHRGSWASGSGRVTSTSRSPPGPSTSPVSRHRSWSRERRSGISSPAGATPGGASSWSAW